MLIESQGTVLNISKLDDEKLNKLYTMCSVEEYSKYLTKNKLNRDTVDMLVFRANNLAKKQKIKLVNVIQTLEGNIIASIIASQVDSKNEVFDKSMALKDIETFINTYRVRSLIGAKTIEKINDSKNDIVNKIDNIYETLEKNKKELTKTCK